MNRFPFRPSQEELAQANWFKAQASNGTQGCVEVAHLGSWTGLRDSKEEGNGPVLLFTPHEWQCFIAGARAGEFDRA